MDLHPRLGQDTPIRQLSDDCLTHFRTALAAIGPDLIEYTPSKSLAWVIKEQHAPPDSAQAWIRLLSLSLPSSAWWDVVLSCAAAGTVQTDEIYQDVKTRSFKKTSPLDCI